jgi:superfamily II DNA or RNA helicase
MAERPRFRRVVATGGSDSPEELFHTLAGRAKSHGYLRGPQQDALRDYVKCQKEVRDVAFELPTGSGKTLVGLLIAEWHRRRIKGRAAFVTLTNQLAAQVIDEAGKMNIPVADLRGDRESRSTEEEGRFLDGSAVAVSTYSNLFNVNPVLKNCETLVLDDAHGGGEVAASMWTVRVTRRSTPTSITTCSPRFSRL